MKLTMVGAGYVGLVTGACFSNTGNDVVCFDVDEKKIDLLKRCQSPIFEPGLTELIERNVEEGRLEFTTDRHRAYAGADVIFVCVGTAALEDGSADLSGVMAAARDIAEVMEATGPKAAPTLIVVKSTVPVGTTHRLRDSIRSRTQTPFHVASNPEFLKEGAAVRDFMKPDRVVCGVENDEAAEILRDLYDPFVRQGNPIIMMDIRSSEMVKYASNVMLASRISFINEIANLCEYYGADVKAVREGMCADGRIGNQFLHPGLGFGGSCFPKDVQAVVNMGRAVGLDCKLAAAVYAINDDQRRNFWNKIVEHYGGNLAGRTLGFWGVAFKPETDDIREAPAIALMQRALAAGARVRAFDPAAAERLRAAEPDVEIVDDMYETLDGCDALVISTEWAQFRHPDFARIADALKEKVIFDGRNIYRRAQMNRLGFTYYSVGRDPVLQGGSPLRAATDSTAGVAAPAPRA